MERNIYRYDHRKPHSGGAHDTFPPPVIATLFKMGVGIGPLVSYLTAWSLFGLQRIILWELPFLGGQVVAVRLIVSALFPLLAGFLSHIIWEKLHL